MQGPQVASAQRFFHVPKFQPPNFQKPVSNTSSTSAVTTVVTTNNANNNNNNTNNNNTFPAHRQHPHVQTTQAIEFDGKRLRKAVTRKTVDYNSAVIRYLEQRIWQRDYRDRRAMQPDSAYYTEMTPPLSMPDNPINAVTTKFVRTSTNKMRCPIFCVAWTPEGRRLVTGASSGEFTLWNGLTFNFETILQAHDSPVRCMVWSHNDVWMVTGDHAGYVKYWQSNMNNVKMFQAHKEPLRGISFCPIDTKFVTCSDDGTVRIWDFLKCIEEKILRGHGADVKCVDWHPQKSLIVSGSKDSQQPIKLWDPKSGQSLATIHAHKNTVMDARWNKNGNWLLTASRDHLIKLFDIRNMSQEMQTFRGHKKEATTLAWHPVHEGLFSSGGSDGCVMFWVVGADKEVGCMEQAHDSCVWSLAWHPLGHILCSGSNDHSSKFWTRNRPGDRMRDKYNLNTLPKGQEDAADYDDSSTISAIPGMGLEYGLPDHLKQQENNYEDEITIIPGLDFTSEENAAEKSTQQKKIPFSKPIPKQFQQQWMESKQPLLLAPPLENQERSNGDIQIPPEIKPPVSMQMPDQFQVNSRSGNQYPDKSLPSQRSSQRSSLLGLGPKDQNQVPAMPLHESGSMPPKDMPYPDEEFSEDMGLSHETWHPYSDHPSDMDISHREMSEHMHRENGALLHNPGMRPGFEPSSNKHPSRGRQERFPPPSNQMIGDEEFMHDNGSRNGPPQHFDGRYSGGDMDPRNSHMGPDDMNYMVHKHSWADGPVHDEYPPMMDFDGPPPSDFNPRMRMRPPQMFHNRGPRGPFRNRSSPYRVVNRGRGRGGFQS